jgi:pyruvate dehydrogenase E2 component (dihydrolipoamide acetyltransferase)
MASEQLVRVPNIGGLKDVEVIELLVQPGDRVEKNTSLITLESDKASMEVPSPCAGVVREIKVNKGEKVSEGTAIALLETAENGAVSSESAKKPPSPGTVELAKPPPPVLPPMGEGAGKAGAEIDATVLRGEGQLSRLPHASPAVRRFARELGADLTQIHGSGPKGRILHADAQAYIKARLQQPASAVAAGPVIDFAAFGPVLAQPRSRIRKLSAAHLHHAWMSIPHVSHHDMADITELEAFRQSLKGELAERGVKLTLLPFLVEAAVAALKSFPDFNASLDATGENLIHKHYQHIGIAVDTPDGLVVPVVRDAGSKRLLDIAAEMADLSERARNRRLRREEIEGGSFSISSLGSVGGQFFTPIINAPEVAILGVCPARWQPEWRGETFVPRLLLPLSLSYDHRVIDGAAAARFMNRLKELLADVRRLLL